MISFLILVVLIAASIFLWKYLVKKFFRQGHGKFFTYFVSTSMSLFCFVFGIAIVADYSTTPFMQHKNKTLKDAQTLSLQALKDISSDFVKINTIDKTYEAKFYNCLGQLMYDMDESYTVDKILGMCKQDYDLSHGKMKDYINTANLMVDFSPWNGSYRPLENYIKGNLKDPSSYEHVKTMYGLVYYGTDRPYMNVKTVYRGKNSFGAIITETTSIKVDAITKEVF